MRGSLLVEFLDQSFQPESALHFGRAADNDIVLDESNNFLHRRAGVFECESGQWYLRNLGATLSISIETAGTATELRPGARTPVAKGRGFIRMEAGGWNYEMEYTHGEKSERPSSGPSAGSATEDLRNRFTDAELRYIAAYASAITGPKRRPVPSQIRIAAALRVKTKTVENTLRNIRFKAREAGIRNVDNTESLILALVSHGVYRRSDFD